MSRIRNLAVVAAAAILVGLLSAAPILDGADGLGIDLAFWLRAHVLGVRDAASPVAVIAIDEETYRRPPFAGMPYTLWTPELAQVLDAVRGAAPRAIGLDVIFPTSMESFIPHFDRPLMLALNQAAASGRIVLAKSQNSDLPIAPYPAFVIAAGGSANVRSVNSVTDRDGVVRRALLAIPTAGIQEPSFDLDLASRASGKAIGFPAEGVRLGDDLVQPAGGPAPLIDFEGGDPYPTYSFADLYACAAAGKAGFFHDAFQGRIVLIGAVLDIEDRLLTSERFIAAPSRRQQTSRCVLPPAGPISVAATHRSFVSGVFVHAQIIDDLISGDRLRELSRVQQGGLTMLIGFAAGLLTLALRPVLLGAALVAFAVLWPLAVTAALAGHTMLPLIDPMAGAAIMSGLTFAYRFVLSDRDKRHIRRAFGYYLPRHLVDQIATTGRMPSLGGEEREVTLWFSDIRDFTRISERAEPAELVARLNDYFATMNAVIEAHGGYVDKYIGDAIVAIFGAPIAAADHASQAVKAALECQERLRSSGDEGGAARFGTRIGLHTGRALVGNIGAGKRLNYTAIGDTVNLASRLEGANKAFGSSILVSAATAAQCAGDPPLREVGRIRVLGRGEPVTVFEPLPRPMPDAARESFAAGLACYYAGRFAEAAQHLAALEAEDPVAAGLRARARTYAEAPPAGWSGVDALAQK